MNPLFKQINHGSSQWKEAVHLREKILREPLGSKFTSQELEEEKEHLQIAGFLNDQLVATAVLVPEGDQLKMQRVVVHDELRNQSIGSRMLNFCEALAKEKGFKMIYCHARDTAVNFYLNNNYLAEGDYFQEDDIPHLKMSKGL